MEMEPGYFFLRHALFVLLLYLQMALPVNAASAVTADGGEFFGEMVDALFEGEGVMRWRNGAEYRGQFHQGLFEGDGVLRLPGGDEYRGRFHEGLFEGQGSLQSVMDWHYEGGFRQGLFSGHGVLTRARGEEYKGEFQEGKFHGQGQLTNENGIIYRGQFHDDEPAGNMLVVWPGGNRYHGPLKDWMPEGQGTYTVVEGDALPEGEYTGRFTAGTLEGKGSFKGKDGSVYHGHFSDGFFHGLGDYQDSQGNRYRGRFNYGEYHGRGELTLVQADEKGRKKIRGVWQYGIFVDNTLLNQEKKNLEMVLYNQNPLLDAALAAVEPQDPDRIDMYFVGIAGDGKQEVFRREVEFVRHLFDQNFQTEKRSIILMNSRSTVTQVPLATNYSIRYVLQEVSKKMDPQQDILFLFVTTHGSRDHELVLGLKGLNLPPMTTAELAAALNSLPLKWKVIVVSACYSGGFINPLKNAHTLVITASSADRNSFGCADGNEMTDFGRAFFQESLLQSASFSAAFRNARVLVRARENEKGYRHSLPMIHEPEAVKKYLQRWRRQFENTVDSTAEAK